MRFIDTNPSSAWKRGSGYKFRVSYVDKPPLSVKNESIAVQSRGGTGRRICLKHVAGADVHNVCEKDEPQVSTGASPIAGRGDWKRMLSCIEQKCSAFADNSNKTAGTNKPSSSNQSRICGNIGSQDDYGSSRNKPLYWFASLSEKLSKSTDGPRGSTRKKSYEIRICNQDGIGHVSWSQLLPCGTEQQ